MNPTTIDRADRPVGASVGSGGPDSRLASPRTMAHLRTLAAGHVDGYADLATASPVDPTPQHLLRAIAASDPAPGYPSTHGSVRLRTSVVEWLRRYRGIEGLGPQHVVPTIGSKEFLGLLPFLLDIRAGDIVVVPELGYPAYVDGATAVGATIIAEDDPARWPEHTRLIWINPPRNPDGRTLQHADLRRAVDRARELGAVLVSDECYGVLNEVDGQRIPSILHAESNGGSLEGILMSSSVSKQSNLAGYRVGYSVGDPELIEALITRRRRLGLIMPWPQQALLEAALVDDVDVRTQRSRHRERIARLRPAVEAAGLRVTGSTDGMYVWATADEDGWATATRLAARGVLCMPGDVFGAAGRRHVRFAVSIHDDRLEQAVERLRALAA